QSKPSQRMSSWIASMYSCSSLIGLVSSKRRLQCPPNSWAIPKLSAIDLGWPMWRYPFGSGGKRVTTSDTLPSRTSPATMSRMKSLRSGAAGLSALTPLPLIPRSVVQGKGGRPVSPEDGERRQVGREPLPLEALDGAVGDQGAERCVDRSQQRA